MKSKNSVSNSIWNAITNLTYVAVNGLLGLIVTKFIIQYFGSDINGINSSSFQLVNILLILEGGLTLATNVALFAPIRKNNHEQINGIISATNKRFKKIGILFFILGTLSSLLYSVFVHTEVSYWVVVYFFMMSLIPAAVNLSVTMKYRSLLLSHQKEYVISLITLITITIGYSLTIFAINRGCGVWGAKAFITFFALVNSAIIVFYCKKNFKYIDLKAQPDYGAIKGTKDVLMGKISGALFTALPILIISVIFPSGAKIASVYAVYASVFSFLSNAIQSFSSAPRFAFGQLFVEGDYKKIRCLFLKYEFIVFVFQSVAMGCAMCLILNFVDLYTLGVTDIQYHNPMIALILGLTSYISTLHKPCGHMINMSGNFKIYKNINVFSVIALVVLAAVGYFIGKFWDLELYGILIGIGFAALLKCACEIFYSHKKILKLSILKSLRILIPNFLIFLGSYMCSSLLRKADGFIQLGVHAVIVLFLLAIISIIVNFVINNNMVIQTIRMLNGNKKHY